MITLQNHGLLDLELLATMGANVKDSDDAIGFFGTGLKYAIATFLREGINFHMLIGQNRYEFDTERKIIRGDEYNVTVNHKDDDGQVYVLSGGVLSAK